MLRRLFCSAPRLVAWFGALAPHVPRALAGKDVRSSLIRDALYLTSAKPTEWFCIDGAGVASALLPAVFAAFAASDAPRALSLRDKDITDLAPSASSLVSRHPDQVVSRLAIPIKWPIE